MNQISKEQKSIYFQDYMPGNICYGCGVHNHDGFQIKSYWAGDESHCIWMPEKKHQGWKGVTNGGVLATLIDCHCMCTAMAAAYKAEGRKLDSLPTYHFATASMNIRYLKPTMNHVPIVLKATIEYINGKKIGINCRVYSNDILTVTAETLAIKVYDSSKSSSTFIKSK